MTQDVTAAPAAAAQDTVAGAAATPGRKQPFAALGLTADEYARIAGISRSPAHRRRAGHLLGDVERALLLQVLRVSTCASSARRRPPTDVLLAGIGQNAGVVDVGQGYAVTFKIESHNHPSYVEPFQGAATGVGGIVRDILAMGARPVAVMDALRFGPADAAGHPPGAAWRGGRHLVLRQLPGPAEHRRGAGFRSLLRGQSAGQRALRGRAAARGPQAGRGDRGLATRSILFGSRTGPDGIGGASVLASASFGGTGEGAKRPSVQVGDPFMEKLLIECCLELYQAGLVVGIQDLGAAGVACATTELAAGGGTGMRVKLDSVPLRDASLGPAEILMSESQERMMAIVEPERVAAFLDICAQVGRAGDCYRRCHRHRQAGDDLARRAGRRHPAGQCRRRRARLRPAGRAVRPARTR